MQKTEGGRCICNRASRTSPNPSGSRKCSTGVPVSRVESGGIVPERYWDINVPYQSAVFAQSPSQMVNLVISQQLGNMRVHKRTVCGAELGCVSDETVCLCCALPCVQHPGLQQICVYGCCGAVWFCQKKKKPGDREKEKERERQTLKREKREREREKRGTKRDRGGQLPRMQFAHISLVPAFSPADVHHPLNYTSPPLIWEGFNIVSALSLSEELQAFHDLFVGAPPVTPSELYRRGEDSEISLIVSATTHMCIHASVL